MAAPDKVTLIGPAIGGVDITIHQDLSWTSDGTSFDVYFGDADPPAFIGNQEGKTYSPGTLSAVTQYFWRVDPINDDGTTEGDVWDFTTRLAVPAVAVVDNPSTGASIHKDLAWEDGNIGSNEPAETYDVFFGNADPPASIGNQASKVYSPGTLVPTTRYYWKINAKNSHGTTPGTVHNFWTEMAVTAPATRHQLGLSMRLSNSFPLDLFSCQ